jgi:hypothetical protein
MLSTMTSSTSNIEAVARDICSKQLSRHTISGVNLAADVDRYWHCVAAELEAGLIDDVGDPVPGGGFDEGLAAYRDWCQRHPESKLKSKSLKFSGRL